MKFYEGCTTLITGASAGLGAEFARQLAPYARELILVARRVDRLEALRDELLSLHPHLSIQIYGADVGREEQRTALADWLVSQNVKVDFLVNNAGLGDHGTFESSEWERVRAMLDVNISALTHLTHLLLPSMTAGGRAAILNVSSVASFFPLPNMAVYSATKAYVTSLSEALAIELRPRGITVTALCPGPVPTEFFSVARRSGGESVDAHYDSMPLFVVTPQEAVRTGLEAVIHDRARVIPGALLCIAVSAALLVPFFVTREILRAFRTKL
jgi:short-subunit dehydrogenase